MTEKSNMILETGAVLNSPNFRAQYYNIQEHSANFNVIVVLIHPCKALFPNMQQYRALH